MNSAYLFMMFAIQLDGHGATGQIQAKLKTGELTFRHGGDALDAISGDEFKVPAGRMR